MKTTVRSLLILSVAAAMAIGVQAAWAHGGNARSQDATHSAVPHDGSFGQPGTAKNVSSTVAIRMSDAMRFSPGVLAFKQGQTVRLRIVNDGKLAHEFVLGTRQEIDEHARMMRKMPDMDHHDPGAVRLAPGQSADLRWQFDRAGEFAYACLIPGHREAGMRGKVVVQLNAER